MISHLHVFTVFVRKLIFHCTILRQWTVDIITYIEYMNKVSVYLGETRYYIYKVCCTLNLSNLLLLY